METEIELKFFVSPEYSEVLERKISEAKVLQHSCRELENTYFDTHDNWLRQHDAGLRIRRFDEVYVQTVKTSGRVVAGLHQRPEYNAEHDSNTPQLSLHPHDIWPEGRTPEQIQSELKPLFSTNFTRQQWLLGMSDGSQIEVAFDQGKVVAGEKEAPICEVELELKSGQTGALFSLARMFTDEGGVRLGSVSKAARGYRLVFGDDTNEIKPIAFVDTHHSDTVESCFVQTLEYALSHWTYHEQIFAEHRSFQALHEINHAICLIRQLLAVYSDVVPKRATAILRQELKWLEQELDWLKLSDYLENLLEDKGHALRKLDARKFLVAKLKALQDKLPSDDDMLKLFHSARYTGLILDLNRWILTCGWQPFLDEKSKDVMAEAIQPFSVRKLEQTWEELLTAFPEGQELSCADYQAQQYCLMRNLYTGISFANLFNEEEQQAFRLPWVDLLQGIDDLLMLKPLESLVDALEGESQEQLQRWLSRQQDSILHAMEQTRAIGLEASPYWKAQ